MIYKRLRDFFGEFVGDCGEGVRNGLAVPLISQNIFIN